jgi:hypothetical protein
VVVTLIAEGVYPSTTVLCHRLGFNMPRPDLNGREIQWRAEVLGAAGWQMCLSPEGGSDSGNRLPSPLRDFGAGSYPAAELQTCVGRLCRPQLIELPDELGNALISHSHSEDCSLIQRMTASADGRREPPSYHRVELSVRPPRIAALIPGVGDWIPPAQRMMEKSKWGHIGGATIGGGNQGNQREAKRRESAGQSPYPPIDAGGEAASIGLKTVSGATRSWVRIPVLPRSTCGSRRADPRS